MSYIEKNILIDGEEVVEKFQLHSLKLVMAWVWGVLFCWLLLIPLIMAISKTIKFHNTEMVVTNKKIIEKYGLVSIHCDEMGLDKIENITIHKSFWGGIFGYGDVFIQGTNFNNIDFIGVKNPEHVRKILNELKSKELNN